MTFFSPSPSRRPLLVFADKTQFPPSTRFVISKDNIAPGISAGGCWVCWVVEGSVYRVRNFPGMGIAEARGKTIQHPLPSPTHAPRNSRKTYIENVKLPPQHKFFRKLEKAVAVRNSLLEKFSGKFRRCWKILHRFSGSTKCYPCQGLGIFRQGKWLLENWPRLRERSWIFSSETATAFLSFSQFKIRRQFS